MRDAEGIVRVAQIDYRVEPYDWVFARGESAHIDAHWAGQCRIKPSLFDGRVLLAHRLDLIDDRLDGACFETSYRTFLAWRDFGFPGAPVANCFAMPALRAADGAFMLGEMSPGTANAGLLYFPAGTPEPTDADAEGYVDLEANILRELQEETGLVRDDIQLEEGWTIVFAGPRVACLKIVRSREPAAALQARLAAFNATLEDPELVRLVPVVSAQDVDPERMPAFMLQYLRSAFER